MTFKVIDFYIQKCILRVAMTLQHHTFYSAHAIKTTMLKSTGQNKNVRKNHKLIIIISSLIFIKTTPPRHLVPH